MILSKEQAEHIHHAVAVMADLDVPYLKTVIDTTDCRVDNVIIFEWNAHRVGEEVRVVLADAINDATRKCGYSTGEGENRDMRSHMQIVAVRECETYGDMDDFVAAYF